MPKISVNQIIEVRDRWVRLKRAVSGPGMSYADIAALDVFEFFAIVESIHKTNNKAND